jgi:hypothetical protein
MPGLFTSLSRSFRLVQHCWASTPKTDLGVFSLIGPTWLWNVDSVGLHGPFIAASIVLSSPQKEIIDRSGFPSRRSLVRPPTYHSSLANLVLSRWWRDVRQRPEGNGNSEGAVLTHPRGCVSKILRRAKMAGRAAPATACGALGDGGKPRLRREVDEITQA